MPPSYLLNWGGSLKAEGFGDGISTSKYYSLMLNGKVYTKRCHCYNIAGNAHELTFSCYKNLPFLSKERTCEYLVDSIISSREKHGFDVWAYVFMPNHVHLLICPRTEQYSISDILLSIKQPVSRKAIAYLKKHNPDGLKLLATSQAHRPYRFWQKGGGYDRNITKVKTVIDLVHYIHNNPIRKALVKSADQWHYSSAADWQNIRKGPITIDFESFLT
jgi:putative transposase